MNGWSFWVSQEDKRLVVYVGEAEADNARAKAVAYVGECIIFKEVELPSDVLRFLGIKPGTVKAGVIQD